MISNRVELARSMRDPSFRAWWEKTALAREVAIALLRYRADHNLSQTQLAAKLGMQQPAIARLEVGEQNPTWETLLRLADVLGLGFTIEIVPTRRNARLSVSAT